MGIAYTCPWLALMQKSVRERKIVKDKCSQCAGLVLMFLIHVLCVESGSRNLTMGLMDSRNEEQTHALH